MKNKPVVTALQAAEKVNSGEVVLVGGFLDTGAPNKVLDALVELGTSDLTLVNNDTAFPDRGVGKMVVNKQFSKIITSHIGTNKETGRQMIAGETQVVLTPQGTLVEQIRAAGTGLGGVLTKTGLGTEVENGKDKITVNGEEYLVEKPLRGNVALIYANKADKFGNMRFHGSTRNFNLVMAMAADLVILEVDELVEIGEIDQDSIHLPGIFVDYIVDRGAKA